MSDFRPTVATISLAAFRHNLDEIRRRVGAPRGIMAIVKANAYGHGMSAMAREAVKWGVQALGVATTDEALELRETQGCGEIPILVMGPTLPADAEVLLRNDISVAIGNIGLLREHLAAGRRLDMLPRLHVKIDTGMGRYGFRQDDLSFLDELKAMPQALEGVMTHFSVSDETDEESRAYTDQQSLRFAAVVREIHKVGLRPVIHASNSGGVLHHATAHFEMVRPGMILYGANPDPNGEALPLRQVMTLSTRIVSIHAHAKGDPISYGRTYRMQRDGRIGILPIGYGDGLPRSLGNRGYALVAGRRVPIRGRVCMDQTMIDLSESPGVQVGDEVVLYGSQGTEQISLEEVARLAGTIAYEITCQVGRRVPRAYVEGGAH